MATPQQAHLTAPTIKWSDGSLFNGFCYIGIAFPPTVADAAVQYPQISMDLTYPPQRLPQWYVIPIRDGVYDQNTTIFYSGQVEPPGCRYAAYFYDINRQRIAPLTAATLFDVSADPYTLTPPALPAPTAATVVPTPEVS